MPSEAGETVTFAIKRHHLYLALGIVVGFGAGYATAMAFGARASRDVGATAPPPSFEELSVVAVAHDKRPSRGPPDAQVILVEFTDYECPFCAQHFRQTYRALLESYDGRLKYVVRNFPLRSIHPQAPQAAEAAECAYEQGRFWEYHDLLFERTPLLDQASLESYASQLGLDTNRFTACLASGRTAEAVERDFNDGLAYGVRSTPTFFINGRAVVGAVPLTQFEQYIDAALAEAGAARRGF